MIASSKRVLVIAAHPDDEILGCGGTIASHIHRGDLVDVAILGEGLSARGNPGQYQLTPEKEALEKAAIEANRILGVTSIHRHQFPDNRLDSVDLIDVAKVVEDLIKKVNPNVVYTHHYGDLNVDHRMISQAVLTACRPMPGSNIETVLFFEIASSTEWQAQTAGFAFHPNWFTDISHTLEKKLKALSAYSSEMRPWPHARSIEALEHMARFRGSQVGLIAAEAFQLGRKVEVPSKR